MMHSMSAKALAIRPEPKVESSEAFQLLKEAAIIPTQISTVTRSCVDRIEYSLRTNSIFCCGVIDRPVATRAMTGLDGPYGPLVGPYGES